ncbi:proton-conducting transporter membrane subunit [Halospeciosus flavus]|uniref:Proton-conducting transporter membrane subunit n=1 Tax=Halospeciosus flavus TaxID=3032283 RepID=A0ABD5Z2V8_9EURY|nr:proton-conducting transporter membrane subunit [Halospeciosus flavus]
MADQPTPTDTVSLPEATTSTAVVPRATTWVVWALFVLSVGALAVRGGTEWSVPGLFVVDGLTVVMWVVVTFFSGIVHSYSRRYMAGDAHRDAFFGRVFAFTLVVLTLTAADHLALFALAWLAMGLVMSSLIGHAQGWPQAQAAAGLARRYFLASSGLLTVALSLLAWGTGSTAISGILGSVDALSGPVALAAAACLLGAAMIQSALFPFQTWLLSSMTAPTPASALMHAGFVNAGGILLTRFAPLLVETPSVMSLAVVVGALSALIGQALLLVQTDVKRELGASTLAQMGFMILQCGLGFFAAAVTHLVLHGFYKAYLFLSSGTGVEQTVPSDGTHARLTVPRVAVSLVTALGGGVLFAVLTGKGLALNSGAVLALVVVLTTLHAARDILRRPTLTPWVRLVAVPLVVVSAVGVYGVLFNAIAALLADVPMTKSPTELSVVHLGVAAAFVVAYLVTEFDLHRSSDRLYVALLNLSQPAPTTLLTQKEDYDDA